MRNTGRLLTLTLLASFVLAVPRAEASVIIDSFSGIPGPFGFPVLSISAGGSIATNFGDLVITDTVGDGIAGSATYTAASIDLTLGDTPVDNYFEIFVTSRIGSWTAELTVNDGASSVISAAQAIGSSQSYFFPYSEFIGVDFTTIDEIVLILTNASAPGDFISVDYLAAVPEPGTINLLGLGLGALAAARWRSD